MTLLKSAKAATVKAELDRVAKNKARVQAGTDGQIDASISTTRRGWTFTGYLTALVAGPAKTTSAGVRVERDF